MTEISIVIPVYNAEPNLQALYRQLIPEMEALSGRFEIIMVEDGSRDRSWAIVEELASQDERVSGIRLSRNFGQHNALLCGIRTAQYDTIVTMDDDLQHPAKEIATLVNKLGEGFDVVYGSPIQEQHGFLRDLASGMTKLTLQNGMGVENASRVSAFRAFRTVLREGFSNYSSPYVSIDVLLTWTTTRYSSVSVAHAPRVSGESNYTLIKLVQHAFNMLTGFSTMPLRLASYVGFAFTLFGLGLLVWLVTKYLIWGAAVQGFTFIASVIVIFAGAQLFALGIFGEYLARIYVRSMGRPAYQIRERCDKCD